MSLFIGVDIGTTNVKVIAANETSAIVCEEKLSYPLYQPQDSYCEQDAEEIFTAFIKVLKTVIAKIDARNIETVCFSAAFHSIMAVDKNGRALTPLLTWADTRSNRYAKELKESGKGEKIYRETGVPIHPMSPLCKIAWIRDQWPGIFAAAHKFISIKEYIWYKLFERFEVDYSMASATGLFNSAKLEWSADALAYCGIGADALSTPVSVLYTAPGLSSAMQSELNLPPGTLFIAGAGDGSMANLGCGAILPGIAALTIGTSGAIRTVTTKPQPDAKGRLFNYLLTDDLYITGGGINNGGIVLQWFMQTFLQKEYVPGNEYDWFFEEIKHIPPGADGLIFLPYILGERAPVWDADAKGVFIGIRSVHTLQHFMRAVIEGICFALLQLLNAISEKTSVQQIYATGGFTQSGLWLQMLADILDKKISIVTNADASAMGTIYLGMYKMGLVTAWQETLRYQTIDAEYIPDAGRQSLYKKNMLVFDHLYEKLKDDFDLLSTLNETT